MWHGSRVFVFCCKVHLKNVFRVSLKQIILVTRLSTYGLASVVSAHDR